MVAFSSSPMFRWAIDVPMSLGAVLDIIEGLTTVSSFDLVSVFENWLVSNESASDLRGDEISSGTIRWLSSFKGTALTVLL